MASTENLKIPVAQLLPSFNKWKTLAKGNLLPAPTVDLTYQTPAGIVNEINFKDPNFINRTIYSPIHDYQPSVLTQGYPALSQYDEGRPFSGYEVRVELRDTYLGNLLNVYPSSNDHFKSIGVYSQLILPEDSEREWRKEQGIILHLTDGFFSHLQHLDLIPDPPTKDLKDFMQSTISISKSNNEIRATVGGYKYDTKGNLTPTEYSLTDEQLRGICSEDFTFSFDESGITGSVGEIDFSLAHADPKALDPDKVFRVLSGQDQEMFIFPVSVSKK